MGVVFKFGIDVIALVPSTLTAEIFPQIPLVIIIVFNVITNKLEVLKLV